METNLVKRLIEIIEAYLLEFCEVNNIQEINLKDHVAVFGSRTEKSIMVIDVDDRDNVKFGVTMDSRNHFKVFGEFSDNKDKFPKTLELVNHINTQLYEKE